MKKKHGMMNLSSKYITKHVSKWAKGGKKRKAKRGLVSPI